jgi:DNA-binding MarR family transcriptional regulator
MKSAYLKFLTLREKLIGNSFDAEVDSDCQKILERIVILNAKDESIMVSDVLAYSDIGSYATLHKKLKTLIELGYIDVVRVEDEHRVKYLVPSKKSEKVFATLGKLIGQCS